MQIVYIDGDATKPADVANGDKKLIVHCCNDLKAWGAGFVVSLSKKWPEPEAAYRAMDQRLGHVSIVKVEENLWVANVIGQHGVMRGTTGELPPVRYEALRMGFRKICEALKGKEGYSIHMPRVASGLAGGDWAMVEVLINDTFVRAGLEVVVYTFPGGKYFDSRY